MYSGMSTQLPERVRAWLSARGWRLYSHQQAMIDTARQGAHVLLVAPTGGGKTMAGFLPSLLELAEQASGGANAATGADGLHTLYISPLKALTVDVHRNLERPIAEMDLPIRAETRTGDTPQSKRQRQRLRPPQLLMTTPESLALLLSYADAGRIFARLRCVIVDELHALVGTKRGDLLALGLARLQTLAPHCRRVGLSATVAHPDAVRAWLSPRATGDDVVIIQAGNGPPAETAILTVSNRIPWSGHMAVHALPLVYERICGAATTIVFVNTRAQAEIVFQQLWRLNDLNLPIALHHGSLAVEQRRKVEAAMAEGRLRAVVTTSSLDLGVDWAAVDLVIQIGAPKGVSRLIQRIGRAGHRLDRTSRAVLVPANRFEHLECAAALDAVAAGELDGEPPPAGGLEVLAQHLLGCACSAPFAAAAMYDEVRRASPYAALSRPDFDDTLRFVENGGYALGGYERYRRLTGGDDGFYRVASPRITRLYRMNIGTIVEAVTIKVRLKRGRVLGEVEESFIQGLQPGDTFIFSGEVLRFEGIRETTAIVSRASGAEPKIPAYAGGRLPLSTFLAARVRAMLADRTLWDALPEEVRDWLALQSERSLLPDAGQLLVEIFQRGGKAFLIAYCFEGRNVHQTLGVLLTRRMERAGLAPLGFVASDYVLAVWSVRPAADGDLEMLFAEDMLGDDLEAWMSESSVMKRTFRNVAVIAGLIERRHPGQEKTGRQVTVSSDLIYNVLRRYEPNHVLLRATRDDAARGLADLRRLGEMLRRIRSRIVVRKLPRVSPLAVPVLLEIGRETVYGEGVDELLDMAARDLIAEATGSCTALDGVAGAALEAGPPPRRRKRA